MLDAGRRLGADPGQDGRAERRRAMFHFDPALKLMSTVDDQDGTWWVNTKGAPDVLLDRCATALDGGGEPRPLTAAMRAELLDEVEQSAQRGLRVLGVARRAGGPDEPVPGEREDAERDLCFVGLVALLDPPRVDVAEAVAALLRRGHPHHRRHRRPRPHGRRGRSAGRHRAERRADRDGRRARRACARRSSTSCSRRRVT